MARVKCGWMVCSVIGWLLVGGSAVAQEAGEGTGGSEVESRSASGVAEAYAGEVGGERRLEALLEYAGKHAPQLREARERLGLGEAEVAGAEKPLAFNPELRSQLGIGTGEFAPRQVEATVMQRLEVAGERGLRIEAARGRAAVLEAEYERARWEVRREVRRLYRLGLVDRRRIELQRRVVGFTDELVEIARERREAGDVGRRAVLVGRAEAATARQRLLERWKGYLRTLADLEATIGWEAGDPPQPAGELAELRPLPPREKLLERAYDEDLELQVLRARLDEFESRRKLAAREVWPNPLVGLGFERERMGTPAVSNKLRMIVGLPLPVWDRNQGEIARYAAREAVVRKELESRKRILAGRVAERAKVVEAAYRQARIYREEVLPAIEEQFELLQEGFELGEMDLLEVMDARDRLLEARRRHLETLAEYVKATSELEALLGGPVREANGG